MGPQEVIKHDKEMGLSQLRMTHKLVAKKIFGDIEIQLWRDDTGNPYVRMERGQPSEKTFCLEHFLLFAEKVGEMAGIVREKIGEKDA